MTGDAPFDPAAAEQMLGPTAAEAARRLADEAPPLTVEQREQIRAVFASGRASQQSIAARAEDRKAA